MSTTSSTPKQQRAEAPVDPRLAEFVEALAEALAADHLRALAATEKQPAPEALPS